MAKNNKNNRKYIKEEKDNLLFDGQGEICLRNIR